MREQLDQPDRQVLADLRQSLAVRLEETRRQLAWVDAELVAQDVSAEEMMATVVVKQVPKLVVRAERRRLSSYDETDALLEGIGRTLPVSVRAVAGAVWHDCGDKSAIDCEAFWVVSGRAAGTLSALAPARVPSTAGSAPHGNTTRRTTSAAPNSRAGCSEAREIR